MSEIERADRVVLLDDGNIVRDTYDIKGFLDNVEDIKNFNLELPLKKRIELALE